MKPLASQVSPAERFERLLAHRCPTCGAGWTQHSLVVVDGSGHGLLLCDNGDLFCVSYPEGDVARLLPVCPEPVPAADSPAGHNCRCYVRPIASPPVCGICGRSARRRVCPACTVHGFAAIEIGGAPRLLFKGHPLPYSPDVQIPGEVPRRPKELS